MEWASLFIAYFLSYGSNFFWPIIIKVPLVYCTRSSFYLIIELHIYLAVGNANGSPEDSPDDALVEIASRQAAIVTPVDVVGICH